MLRRLAPYRKAILAAVMGALTAVAATVPDGITLREGMAAWVAGLIAGLSVYAVPNAPEPSPARPDWVGRRLATDERFKR